MRAEHMTHHPPHIARPRVATFEAHACVRAESCGIRNSNTGRGRRERGHDVGGHSPRWSRTNKPKHTDHNETSRGKGKKIKGLFLTRTFPGISTSRLESGAEDYATPFDLLLFFFFEPILDTTNEKFVNHLKQSPIPLLPHLHLPIREPQNWSESPQRQLS